MTTDSGASTVYCTIVAQNYLPQAMTLHRSLEASEPNRELVVLVVDAHQSDLTDPARQLRVVGLDSLGLDERELVNLAAIYDVLELSTALKPLLMLHLLEQHERVVFLDPDLWVVSPMDELGPLLDHHGIILTPHFLEPIPPGTAFLSEVHSLTVGVHNLGFCAASRSGRPFLSWWWSHLQRECLIYPLLGLFVDQKWTDVGKVLFDAHSLKLYGYNVGPWNLHERRFERRDDALVMTATGEPLRLYHFSGFTPERPDDITIRFNQNVQGEGLGFPALGELSNEYAAAMLESRRRLGELPAYRWAVDSRGRALSSRVRRAYRRDLLRGSEPPSPFDPVQARSFARWRRRAVGRRAAAALGDASIAAKYAFPDSYRVVRDRLPGPFRKLRSWLLRRSEIRR